jgi:hypothetical protein
MVRIVKYGILASMLSLALLPFLMPAHARAADEADGIFVTVPNPITEGSFKQIKSRIDGTRNQKERNIKKVVFDFNPEGKDAFTESYSTVTASRRLHSYTARRPAIRCCRSLLATIWSCRPDRRSAKFRAKTVRCKSIKSTTTCKSPGSHEQRPFIG